MKLLKSFHFSDQWETVGRWTQFKPKKKNYFWMPSVSLKWIFMKQ